MTEIVVACIALFGVVITVVGGVVTAQIQAARRAVGVPNGEGNVIQMLETILGLVRDQGARLTHVEHQQERIEGEVDEIRDALRGERDGGV